MLYNGKMVQEDEQSEIRSARPRDVEDRPKGVATLKDISDKVDDARQVALDTREEFHVFQTALIGAPGVSRGALGEIRDGLVDNANKLEEANRQRAHFDAQATIRNEEFMKALPGLINQTVEDTDNVRLKNKFTGFRTHMWTLIMMALSGIIVAVAIVIFHIGTSAH